MPSPAHGPRPGAPSVGTDGHPLWRIASRLLLEPLRAIERDSLAERRAFEGRIDPRPAWVLTLAALVLTFEHYAGDRPAFDACFPSLASGRWGALLGFGWWSGAKLLGYLLVPAAALRLAGIPLRDCGFTLAGTRRLLAPCAALYLVALPALVLASRSPAFAATYPLYRGASRSLADLLAWEALYGASFVAVEFFFRGFLLFPLRPSMGVHAPFVAAIPYCMIHFTKPPAEAAGSIAFGIILGAVALRTRSIAVGALFHVAVAWTMDLLALARAGLPHQLLP